MRISDWSSDVCSSDLRDRSRCRLRDRREVLTRSTTVKPAKLIELARNRQPAEVLLANVLDENMSRSIQACQNLVQAAKALKISLPDYLTLAIDTEKGDFKGSKLNGFAAALAHLGLPIRAHYANGILRNRKSTRLNSSPSCAA